MPQLSGNYDPDAYPELKKTSESIRNLNPEQYGKISIKKKLDQKIYQETSRNDPEYFIRKYIYNGRKLRHFKPL